MISFKWFTFVCCPALLLLLSLSCGGVEFVRNSEFSNYQLIYPRIYHGREKREISSSKETEEGKSHMDHLSIMIYLKDNEYILDLQLNKNLLPKNYFEKHQKNGKYVVDTPTAEDAELCHYNGHIRGIKTSWVAVSTCNGIRGVMYDGKELHYIENASGTNFSNSLTDTHVVYSHSDLKSNTSCGFTNSFNNIPYRTTSDVKNHRFKRDAEKVQGPYNANRLSRYVELVLVVDNREYKAFNEDTVRVYQHCKDLVNIINSLYMPLNIFIALVGVVIWTERDECQVEKNADTTLNHFLQYRKENLVKEHPNDNAQLLTKLNFDGGVVGKALKGPICTYEYSGGVNVDHSEIVGLVAATVAHEMGHNLGMEHDAESCECPSERCIMAPSSSSTSPTEWSSCSKAYLALAFEHGMDYCLRNKPLSLFEGPVCGNGFVEPGEQCDCGLKHNCNNPCCNASTCTLHTNASCATGECCNLQTCKPHSPGTKCRSAERECDLPEYCTGKSEYCPDDVFKMDGERCSNGTLFCYQGNCRSHSGQCRILWGPSGTTSPMQCYNLNTDGNVHGNCGYDRVKKTYIKCQKNNIQCGMLQCIHYNEKLEFGIESGAFLSQSFINNGQQIIPCRTAVIDFGLNEIDPGLTPDGAKCGENEMCLNQTCLSVDSFRKKITNACPDNCNGNGICNSKGHCHCNDGFAPPSCEYSGPGGSEDSGPSEDPSNYDKLRTVFWYMMLTLVPLFLVLASYSYYVRKSPSYFWKRNQRRTVYVPFVTCCNLNFKPSWSSSWFADTYKKLIRCLKTNPKNNVTSASQIDRTDSNNKTEVFMISTLDKGKPVIIHPHFNEKSVMECNNPEMKVELNTGKFHVTPVSQISSNINNSELGFSNVKPIHNLSDQVCKNPTLKKNETKNIIDELQRVKLKSSVVPLVERHKRNFSIPKAEEANNPKNDTEVTINNSISELKRMFENRS